LKPSRKPRNGNSGHSRTKGKPPKGGAPFVNESVTIGGLTKPEISAIIGYTEKGGIEMMIKIKEGTWKGSTVELEERNGTTYAVVGYYIYEVQGSDLLTDRPYNSREWAFETEEGTQVGEVIEG